MNKICTYMYTYKHIITCNYNFFKKVLNVIGIGARICIGVEKRRKFNLINEI